MHKLSRTQLDLVAQHIQQTKPHQALQAELLDHIASLIEQRMDQGQAFPDAFDQVTQQANPLVLDQLKQLYVREVMTQPALATPAAMRIGLRSKRRPATRPFYYMFLSNGLTFLILMGFLLVVSRPLAVPIGAFQTAWGAAVAGFAGVFTVRWWLTRKSRKPKRLLPA